MQSVEFRCEAQNTRATATTALQAPESTAKKAFDFNSSTVVDTSRPFSARHFEYSTEYSTYIPCRQTAIGWPTVDSGASSIVH
eukprot:1193974-Prorocentrum_minimum.AAC.3